MGLLDDYNNNQTFDNNTQNYFDQNNTPDVTPSPSAAPSPGTRGMPAPASGTGMMPTGMLPGGAASLPPGAGGVPMSPADHWTPPSAQPTTNGMGPGQRFNAQGHNQGPLGPNPTYGGMQGYLLAQNELRARSQDAREADANARANDTQDMTREGFSWSRQDRAKQQFVQNGMVAAAHDGGYEGVIHFLEQADPAKAIEFTKAKVGLDKDIMSNDIYKSLVPVEKAKALAEGYGILGKMGTTILAAPPDQRQTLYNTMAPVVQAINPNAPKDVNSALPMFMLSVAQSTPENMLFAAKKTAANLSTDVGKTLDDIHKAVSYYGADSPQVKALSQNLTDQQTSLKLNQAKIASTIADKQNKNPKDTTGWETYMTGFMKDQSKDFMSMQDAYNKIQATPIKPANPGDSMTFNDINLWQNSLRVMNPKSGNRFQPNGIDLVDKSMNFTGRLGKIAEKLRHGLALSEDDRVALKATAGQNYNSAKVAFDGMKSNVMSAAHAKGIANPEQTIVVPYSNPTTTPSQPVSLSQLAQQRDEHIQQAMQTIKDPAQRQKSIDWANQAYQSHAQAANSAIGTNSSPEASTTTNSPSGAPDPLSSVRQQIANNDKTLQSNAQALNSGSAAAPAAIQEKFQ